ncbi:hypothetical protein Misp01_17350 [Microtetraspora sp. NBRC 13810]|nr:hypothetical protein Misp01_17350 [Microtetraspora sp. NBRC 13810]
MVDGHPRRPPATVAAGARRGRVAAGTPVAQVVPVQVRENGPGVARRADDRPPPRARPSGSADSLGPLPNLGQKLTDLSSVTDVALNDYALKSSEVISAMFRTGPRVVS